MMGLTMTRALKVLILEDVESDAQLMIHELKQAGFMPDWMRVDTENQYLTALGSDPDLILSDYNLPQFDAFLALQLMQMQKLDIPFIVISGAITEDVAVEFMKQGASDYLLKDRMARLGQAVVRALEQRGLREEKRRTEEALRREYERRKDLEDIVNRSPIVVLLWRNEVGWPVEMVSENVNIFGYSADDFISGRIHYADIIHPDDLRRIENEVCQHTVQDDGKFVQNYRIITKDGQIRWVEDRTTVRQNPSGEITHYQDIIVDVTSRMQAEEALRQEKELAHLYLDIVGTIIISISSDHTVSLVNQAGCHLLGYREDEIIGMNWFSRFLPEQVKEDVEEIFDLLMAGIIDPVRYVEGKVLTRDGEERIVAWHNTILRDEAGNITGTLSSGDDITESKRAKEELQSSLRFLEILINTIPSPIFYKDRLGRYIGCNESFARQIIGLSKESIMGKSVYDLRDVIPADLADRYCEMDERLFQERSVQVFEMPVQCADGVRRVFLFAKATFNNYAGDVAGIVGVMQDITERKRMEKELSRKTTDLTRSNQDLEHFAYIASHDLQEPLRTITRFVQLLQKRYQGMLDQDADEFIGFIVGGTKRMQQLINDLLTYSRVNTRREPLRPMKIEDALQRAMQDLRYVLEESRGTVTYEEMPSIVADEQQMTQLFQNLIGNALKFHGDEAPHVEISAIMSGNDWIFSIRDNGIGIDSKYKDRIFEIFQRLHTHEEYSGTGIGLAIAKKIVERHDGHIWVESEPRKGSTFYFTIPCNTR
ncbi:MAG: PAS domain S-box protein [Methanothrix sp.]|nr:PAS domain S-box protein [Methanothrix sp.]